MGSAETGRAYLKEHGLDPAPVPWMDEAWTLGRIARTEVTRLPWVESQQLFVQSLSSMAAVMELGVEPGHDVLDLCAAPGAKTSLLARCQQGRGILVANDLSRRRTAGLRALLKRLGIEETVLRTGPGEAVGRSHARCFDRVLADVPCSSEGRFHASEASTWANWSESAIRGLAKRQQALLEAACAAARPGGLILYATCTMAPEENERVVDRVLRRGTTDVELLPIDLPVESSQEGLASWGAEQFLPELKKARRMLGSETATPFFMAKLRRRS